jgi:hypothetical protein
MKENWNVEAHRRHCLGTLREAEAEGIERENLEIVTLDGICKGCRCMQQAIRLAYWLG